ncbi:NRT1/ PTR family 7.3-like protein [Tanacetum coccineum]
MSLHYLPENFLSGKIPPEVGNCTLLSDLQLDDTNQLEGSIAQLDKPFSVCQPFDRTLRLRLLDECTRDCSLDWHGKPAVKRKTGGWKSGMLLLVDAVNEGLATLAFTEVEVNMVLFS